MRISAASSSLQRRLLLLVAILTLLIFAGGWFSTARAAETNPAFVRIIHASPDIGIVDVFVDGTKILDNFQFGTVTGYVPLPQGTHPPVSYTHLTLPPNRQAQKSLPT